MKKIPTMLLALASGWAGAQTPGVTVYGQLDAFAGRSKGAATGVNARDQAVWRVDGGPLSASHLGFRGTEDLGGGTSASFDISAFIRNDTGASGRSDAIGPPVNVAGDPFWARAAWVGIGNPGYGRVRLGNITTLMFLDSLLGNAFGDSTGFSPLLLVTFIGSPLSGGTGWTNTAVYDSPTWSGASFSVARSAAETQGGANASVRASFVRAPLAVSAVWQDVKKNPLTFADGTSANNTRSWQIGGSYDFTVVKVFAHVGQISNRGTESTPADIGYRVWDVSASVPVGEGRILAGYAVRSTDDTPAPVPATASGGNVKREVLTVGYDHFVSKRTDVYAVTMSDRTETRTLPAPPSIVKASGTTYGVGLRHRF